MTDFQRIVINLTVGYMMKTERNPGTGEIAHITRAFITAQTQLAEHRRKVGIRSTLPDKLAFWLRSSRNLEILYIIATAKDQNRQISISEIGRHLGTTRPNVSRILKEGRTLGLIDHVNLPTPLADDFLRESTEALLSDPEFMGAISEFVFRANILETPAPSSRLTTSTLTKINTSFDSVRFHTNTKAWTVGVLPFKDRSSNQGLNFFVDGLTEGIITELSKFKDLGVVSGNSTSKYKETPVDAREAGKDLNTRFVLEGSADQQLDVLRISAQLLDTKDGCHVWAEKVDRDLSHKRTFEIQDELSKSFASVIGDLWGVLGNIKQRTVLREDRNSLDSDQSVAYGNAYFRTGSEEEHFRAREIIERAREKDPGNGNVWAQAANLYMAEHWFSHNPLPNSLDRCLRSAQRAVELDSGSDRTYASLASAHFYRNDTRGFRAAAEQVLKIAPSSGMRANQMGRFYYLSGDHKRGMDLVTKGINSMRRVTSSPIPGFMRFCYFIDHYRNERYEEALAETSKMDMPRFWAPYALSLAASINLDLQNEIDFARERLIEIWPKFADHAENAIRNLVYEPDVTDSILFNLKKPEIGLQVQ